jgi:hypothetical protein
MDLIIVNLVISSLTLLFSFVEKLKCRHIEGCCCVSDCVRTPLNTPNNEKEILLE